MPNYVKLELGVPIQDVVAPYCAITKQARSFQFAELSSEELEDPLQLQPTDDPGADLWVEPALGSLMLKPNCLKPGFWDSSEFHLDRFSEDEIRLNADNWRFFQADTATTRTGSGAPGTPGFAHHEPIVPSYAPLQDFLTQRAPDCVWVWETIPTLTVNEGFAARWWIVGTGMDAPDHLLILGIGDLVFDVLSNLGVVVFRRQASGTWRPIGVLLYGSTPKNARSMHVLTVIPVGARHLAIYLSDGTLNKGEKAAHYTGTPETAARAIDLTRSKFSAVLEWDPQNDWYVKLPGGNLAAAVKQDRYQMVLGLARVRFSPVARTFTSPEEVPQFGVDRTLAPNAYHHSFRNGPLNNVQVAAVNVSGLQAQPTDEKIAIRIDLRSHDLIHSPEVAGVTTEWPAEFITPADATEDVSSKWQLVRFTRSVYFDEPAKAEFKLVHGRTPAYESRLHELPRSYRLSIRQNDDTFKMLSQGFVNSPKMLTLMGAAGVFEQSNGYCGLNRAFERELGVFRAVNGMPGDIFFKVLFQLAGYPADRVVVDVNLGGIESAVLPEDWFNFIEGQKIAQAARAMLRDFGKFVRIVEDYDESGAFVRVYRRPDYTGTAQHIFTDVDARLRTRLYDARCLDAVPTWKILSYPEIEVHGAEMHSLLMLGASGSSPGADRNQVVARQVTAVYDDPDSPLFEGQWKSRVISAPSHPLLATEQAAYNVARNIWDTDSKPTRFLKCAGEWHPRIDIDHFADVFVSNGEGGEIYLGAYRILELDVEIQHDAERPYSETDRATWRCNYLMEKVD